tara:strand:- start:711 stop:1526 length:816 start_codon:yes stop_codon:yes gene_type:complete
MENWKRFLSEEFDENTYTVKDDDNLTKIAKKFNTTVSALMKLNPKLQKAGKHKIYTGWKIKLPSTGSRETRPQEIPMEHYVSLISEMVNDEIVKTKQTWFSALVQVHQYQILNKKANQANSPQQVKKKALSWVQNANKVFYNRFFGKGGIIMNQAKKPIDQDYIPLRVQKQLEITTLDNWSSFLGGLYLVKLQTMASTKKSNDLILFPGAKKFAMGDKHEWFELWQMSDYVDSEHFESTRSQANSQAIENLQSKMKDGSTKAVAFLRPRAK